MALTQEYEDCQEIITKISSSEVEVQNFYNSIVSMIDTMVVIDADAPRRAKFDTMYGKIDGAYNKQAFDAYIASLQALKTNLEDNGFIPE